MIVSNLKNAFPIGEGYQIIQKDDFTWERSQDEFALKVVLQDIQKAESWVQTKTLPTEWNLHDRLYLFQVPIAMWDGTQIPRSHLGMPLVLEHIESIIPQAMLGLFADEPPFESEPRPRTSMDTARANDALIQWELKQCDFREEMRLGIKSALLYGNGIWKWGWKSHTKTRVKKVRQNESVNALTGAGTTQNIPVGDPDDVQEVTEEIEVNIPTFEHVNIRYVLFDPGLRRSDPRKGKFAVHRMYLTAEELDALRDVEGYKNIPSREELKKLFMPQPRVEYAYYSVLETKGVDLGLNREFKALPRPMDSTFDPLHQPYEVLEYWTKDRVYTIVQRQLVIRNEKNPFGVIPFLAISYYDVLDSFYGIGVTRLIGNEQRMQQGVVNAYLDDLSLSLMGMFVRQRGMNAPAQNVRMRPGGVLDADGPDSITMLQRPTNIGQDALTALAASDARAQRRTAANEMAVQGDIPSEKSSITRTATGVNMLAGGSGAKLQMFVENLANQVFVPFIEAVHQMNGIYLKPSQIQKILSDELSEAYQADPLDMINGDYDFKVLAASKMQARRTMAQSLPLIYQFILTDPVIQALAQEGKKVNVQELVKMTFDVSGWPNRQNVIVAMTDEDMQRMQQQNQMVQQQQLQQQKQQDKLQVIEEENIGRSGRDVIRSLLKHAEQGVTGTTEGYAGVGQ